MIKLLNGDCLELMKKLPDGSIDLILADPPYGIGFQSGYRKNKYKKIKNDDNLKWLSDFISVSYEKLKENGVLYCFCSFHKIDIFKQEVEKKFKLKNILVWEKNNTSMGDLKGDFAPKVEFILFATKGRPLIRGKRKPNIFAFKRANNKLHPTQKPVDLLEFLISKFSDKNDVVLDPFMGSGSTGVACKNLSRNFIGIELDEEYYKIAKERIGGVADDLERV